GISAAVEERAVPVCDSQGKVVKWYGTNTDIEDRKQAETALEQAAEEVQQYAARLVETNRDLQDFAFIASHDLQEPLRKVQAFGERLSARCGPQLGEEGHDYLDRMTNAASRMQSMITDLLAYSRVTTKTRPFTLVDLEQVAQGVLSDLEVEIERSQGQVALDRLPTVEADPVQIRQLLQNLIGNALKFHRPDSPPRVKVSGETLSPAGPAGSTMVQIRVEDNGIGFDEQFAERIFQPFQRLHGRSEYEGTGIGLAICRKIVERHAGKITVESKPGQGATFIVTLPLERAA
ncbi:MAG TPA: ATP-binding protein, partial [Anaerolineales bacterium]